MERIGRKPAVGNNVWMAADIGGAGESAATPALVVGAGQALGLKALSLGGGATGKIVGGTLNPVGGLAQGIGSRIKNTFFPGNQ